MVARVGKKQNTGKMSHDTSASEKLVERPDRIQDRISNVAYHLWEQRGCQEGDSVRNWLDTEAIVMEQIREAK
ncbi:hypothetical protein W02_20650 [Nitrospira sp. KM1]|uniref:DUF2934 domain-containing protein n=1 Tax=Nitrospira sp. KM1 TaxID=1936990 RepID=UPI0013A7307C|nr:DUF2934 domain-containing protein [Nitrospira sp. KM1]BCA54925.1 hypothetical protein W02_20650 [Nitrospira sp. KM1]